MFHEAIKFFKLNYEQKNDIKDQIGSEVFTIDFLVNFFNQKLDKGNDKYALLKDIHFTKDNQRFLLVLDNCQNLFDKDLEKFKSLIFKLEEECEKLNIVIVSRIKLYIQNQNIKNIELGKIKNNKDAITFFESRLDFNDELQIS